jgi:hypothetical protein
MVQVWVIGLAFGVVALTTRRAHQRLALVGVTATVAGLHAFSRPEEYLWPVGVGSVVWFGPTALIRRITQRG